MRDLFDRPQEVSLYVLMITSCILYGLYLVLVYLSAHFLCKNDKISRYRQIFYLTYSGVLLALNTTTFACWTFQYQTAWINHRDDAASFLRNISGWYVILGDYTQTVANIVADALLIYRCYIIFNKRYWMAIISGLCLLAFACIAFISNEGHVYDKETINLVVSSMVMTIGLNVVLTILICVKLALAQRRTIYRKTYRKIIIIFAESSAISSIIGVILLLVDRIWDGSLIYLGFASIWAITLGISPQLIVLRFAMGTAWTTPNYPNTLITRSVPQSTPLGIQTQSGLRPPVGGVKTLWRSQYMRRLKDLKRINNPLELELQWL